MQKLKETLLTSEFDSYGLPTNPTARRVLFGTAMLGWTVFSLYGAVTTPIFCADDTNKVSCLLSEATLISGAVVPGLSALSAGLFGIFHGILGVISLKNKTLLTASEFETFEKRVKLASSTAKVGRNASVILWLIVTAFTASVTSNECKKDFDTPFCYTDIALLSLVVLIGLVGIAYSMYKLVNNFRDNRHNTKYSPANSANSSDLEDETSEQKTYGSIGSTPIGSF